MKIWLRAMEKRHSKTEKYVLEYDRQVDAAYIRIRNGKVQDTVEVGKGVLLDRDNHNRVIGIEILGFSKANVNLNAILSRVLTNIAVSR